LGQGGLPALPGGRAGRAEPVRGLAIAGDFRLRGGEVESRNVKDDASGEGGRCSKQEGCQNGREVTMFHGVSDLSRVVYIFVK
jgi:hypothetical protein